MRADRLRRADQLVHQNFSVPWIIAVRQAFLNLNFICVEISCSIPTERYLDKPAAEDGVPSDHRLFSATSLGGLHNTIAQQR
jgi:hypothetical protein